MCEPNGFVKEHWIPELACRVFGKRLIEARIVPSGAVPLRVFLEDYFLRLKTDGFEHVTLRVNASDTELVEELKREIGPPIVTMEKFSFCPSAQEIRPTKLLCQVREHRDDDLSALKDIAHNSFRFTRFYRDSFFNDSDCDRLYEELIAAYFRDPSHSRIIVAEKRDKIIGFLAWKIRQEQRQARTISIAGGGLGGVLPGNAGCYLAVICRSIELARPEWEILEYDCLSDAPAVRRIFEYFRMTKEHEDHIFQVAL